MSNSDNTHLKRIFDELEIKAEVESKKEKKLRELIKQVREEWKRLKIVNEGFVIFDGDRIRTCPRCEEDGQGIGLVENGCPECGTVWGFKQE